VWPGREAEAGWGDCLESRAERSQKISHTILPFVIHAQRQLSCHHHTTSSPHISFLLFFLFDSFTDVSTAYSSPLHPDQPLPRLAFRGRNPPRTSRDRRAALLSTATPFHRHPTSGIIAIATEIHTANDTHSTHHHPRNAHSPPIPPSHLRRVATQRQHALLWSRVCKVSAASQLQPPSPSCVPVPAFLPTPATISPQHTVPTRRDSLRLNRYCRRPIPHRTT
jgi:hypothetical protein